QRRKSCRQKSRPTRSQSPSPSVGSAAVERRHPGYLFSKYSYSSPQVIAPIGRETTWTPMSRAPGLRDIAMSSGALVPDGGLRVADFFEEARGWALIRVFGRDPIARSRRGGDVQLIELPVHEIREPERR